MVCLQKMYSYKAITATTGSITGILHVDTSDTQKLSLGKDVSGTNDGIHVNDVNYWYTDGNFKVGDSQVTLYHQVVKSVLIN